MYRNVYLSQEDLTSIERLTKALNKAFNGTRRVTIIFGENGTKHAERLHARETPRILDKVSAKSNMSFLIRKSGMHSSLYSGSTAL